ncbi:unnamed protein product [Heterobilharzia americana]|nr:unnamed protein product [Heterobilharzia americana]
MGTSRIVMLLDMDCFYVQVEQRERPETRGKPCVVVQYNEWKGGGALAVSYEARALGIKRGMFGDIIRAQYPDIIMFKVPEKRGKAELTKYRVAGSEVIHCISEFTKDIERASIDEAYVDLTDIVDSTLMEDENLSSLKPNLESFVVANSDIAEQFQLDLTETNCLPLTGVEWIKLLDSNFEEGRRLAVASELVYNIRQAIFKKTGFKCSAGIGPNKSIAKLACSLNKPNKQTLIPRESIPVLLGNTHINKIRNLGGKLGKAVIKQFNIETLGQLSSIPISILTKEFGEKTANWLHDLSRGIDHEVVASRSLPQSVGCSKNFLGRATLTSSEQIKRWLLCLTEELFERLDDDLEQHQRYPTRLILYARTTNNSHDENGNVSDTNLKPDKCSSQTDKLASAALATLKEVFFKGEAPEVWDPGITCLGLSAGKFAADPSVSNADIRYLLQKKQEESPKLNTVVQEQSISSLPLENTSSISSSCVVVTCTDDKNNSCSSSSEKKRNFDNTSIDGRNSCTSFFKRLRVAEISAPLHPVTLIDNSHSLLTQRPTEIQNEIHSNFIDCLQRPGLFESEHSVVNESPCIEVDSESRHSSTSDSTNFFTSYSVGDWIICEKCNSRVSVWQIPEHEDFHIAQRIQHEWKNEATSVVELVKSTPVDSSNNIHQIENSLSNKISSFKAKSEQQQQQQPKQTKKSKKSHNSTCGTLDKYFHRVS